MWFKERKGKPDWAEAQRHLSAVDPAMKRMIARVGPCTLAPRTDYFVALLQSIFTQQISTVVAGVLFKRFRAYFPRGRPTPALVLLVPDEKLKAAGLSRQKISYVRDLARRFGEGEIPVRRFAKMSDEEVVQALLPIKGVGRWTAEMFLIFVMNRPDLLPVDDLGVKKVVQGEYGLKALPKGEELIEIGEKWRPWRTVATWYLWRYGGLAGEKKSEPQMKAGRVEPQMNADERR